MDNFLYAVLIIFIFISLANLLTKYSKYRIPPASYLFIVLLGIVLVGRISIFPDEYGMDKLAYQNAFENLSLLDFSEVRDIGFTFYTYLVKQVIDDSIFYFAITAIIYVIGYFVFANKFIDKKYVPFLLIACFASFGFTAYAVNTIRAGLALSLLLIAISNNKKPILFFILSIAAISCHKSMLLPFSAFFITRYYNTTKSYGYFWIACLLISALNISFISNFVLGIIGDSDDRFNGYLSDSALARYNAGFRVDFVIYSVIPILVARYYIYKLKVVDSFYQQLFNTYLFANGIWLIVIRMAFTDRIAYLSWFLIPFLLLYPLLKYPLPINQKKWVAVIILGIFCFTSFMYFKK